MGQCQSGSRNAVATTTHMKKRTGKGARHAPELTTAPTKTLLGSTSNGGGGDGGGACIELPPTRATDGDRCPGQRPSSKWVRASPSDEEAASLVRANESVSSELGGPEDDGPPAAAPAPADPPGGAAAEQCPGHGGGADGGGSCGGRAVGPGEVPGAGGGDPGRSRGGKGSRRRARGGACAAACDDCCPGACCEGSPGRRSSCRESDAVVVAAADPEEEEEVPCGRRVEELLQELFRAQDLNGDGLLQESELVSLNEAVEVIHRGDSADVEAVRVKYRDLFRERLDAEGRPVPYKVFRRYMLQILCELDKHEDAQEMIVEQFIAEARLALTVVRGGPPDDTPPLVRNLREGLSRGGGGLYGACLQYCTHAESNNEFRREAMPQPAIAVAA